MAKEFILTEWMRGQLANFMGRIGRFLHGLGIHADAITVMGFVVVALAAYIVSKGEFQWGGLVLVLGLPLDAVDGAVARAAGKPNKWGGVLDSTLDRYADAFIFGALGYHFAVHDQFDLMLLATFGLMGSLLVSYVRARAGEAGLSVKVGLLDRFARVIIIVAVLLVPFLMVAGLWVLAIGTNFTVLQRMWYVYRNT